jgi:hypothetical protein
MMTRIVSTGCVRYILYIIRIRGTCREKPTKSHANEVAKITALQCRFVQNSFYPGGDANRGPSVLEAMTTSP